MIGLLLFLNALRIGPRAALGSLGEARDSMRLILVYQLAAPLIALGLAMALGIVWTVPALALILMLSAPSVTGSPNFTAMLGHDPAQPMRLMLVGTALFPLTVIPVLIGLPSVETISEVLAAALRLLAVIALAVGAAFVLRLTLWRQLGDGGRGGLDGASALLLGFVVIGLMSAAGPALRSEPAMFFGFLMFAFLANFSLQVLAFFTVARRQVGASIVAGNRNIALFLVALPPETTTPLLLFIACYQVPMYLTPILLGRLYRRV